MKKLQIFILFLTILLFSLLATARHTVPTITYFPPDDSVYFPEVTNEFSLINNILHWIVGSKTNKQTYLRQDIALLFVNGYFKGFMNAWEANGQTIELKEQLSSPSSGLYTSISYHYSETQTEDRIRSQAVMGYSSANINCEAERCDISKQQVDQSPMNLAHVQQHWQDLADHFNINQEEFHQIALTDLIKYKDEPLPSFTQEKTDDIINHLWEGLYANYFVELMSTPEGERMHIMPLILYNEQQLYILYEMHHQKEQLIQQISM